jgi:hypothetical protein
MSKKISFGECTDINFLVTMWWLAKNIVAENILNIKTFTHSSIIGELDDHTNKKRKNIEIYRIVSASDVL